MAEDAVDRALLGLAMTTEDKLEERVAQLLVPLLNLVSDDTHSSTYKKVRGRSPSHLACACRALESSDCVTACRIVVKIFAMRRL